MRQDTIVIAGELTIYQVADIRLQMQQVLNGVDGSDAIALDLGNVSECDGAGLQLLLVFARAVTALGSAVVLTAASAVINDLLAEYGLADRFVCQPAGGAA
ncbi:STAS domain-containing protein [Actimicrobium antarcticum]|uniref:STAS domain-containing protein n=1 Tax=Actimicrobium antarcticum TaxID=1051899 RepID=A0ABP7SP94_9BURK